MIHVFTKTESRLSTIAVSFNAGSRNESLFNYNSGIAHMLEHSIFKGTKSRTANQIQSEIAFLGGNVNAFTSHEKVVYYIRVPFENIESAMDILSDIVFNSIFPEDEFLKEKEVVKEEEMSSNDDVGSYMWDNFSKAFFDNYLATSVIGTQETISEFTSDEVRRFYEQFCNKKQSIISLSGNHTKKEARALMIKHFGKQNGKIKRSLNLNKSNYKKSNVIEINKSGIEHTYIWIAFPSVERNNPSYHAAILCADIMGDGMDSRLFRTIREERGLVYSIDASISNFQYGGFSMISCSTRDENTDEVLILIKDEISTLIKDGISEFELIKVKNKMRSRYYGALENGHSRAIMAINRVLYKDDTLDEFMRKIDEVTVDDIVSVAKDIYNDNYKLTLICRS